MLSSSSLFAVLSLAMLMICQTVGAIPVMPLPLRVCIYDRAFCPPPNFPVTQSPFIGNLQHVAHARSLAADKHIREAAALPLDDVIRVYERQDIIPDTIPTMAPCVHGFLFRCSLASDAHYLLFLMVWLQGWRDRPFFESWWQ